MQNVTEIANSCSRLECMIFGMGDYAASQGLVVKDIGTNDGYPGDMFHYPRYQMTIAARVAGIDAVDGPLPTLEMMKLTAKSVGGRLRLGWLVNGRFTPRKSSLP